MKIIFLLLALVTADAGYRGLSRSQIVTACKLYNSKGDRLAVNDYLRNIKTSESGLIRGTVSYQLGRFIEARRHVFKGDDSPDYDRVPERIRQSLEFIKLLSLWQEGQFSLAQEQAISLLRENVENKYQHDIVAKIARGERRPIRNFPLNSIFTWEI